MSAFSRCDGCAVELLPESSFCHACGKPVDAAGGAQIPASGEHKRITVLFVDAFGSIGLGDRLDAEQWHDIVESFFSIVSIGVQHFGGTIDRLTGEGIKVLFGAPAALENHATQACHAALHIASRLRRFADDFRNAAGIEFAVRMGLNSGEVVFGPVGGDPEHSFTSQGHTAALAARMQQLASPGQIYLSEQTAALVADFFELREVGALPVRNASEPMRVFELRGAREERSRLDAARERGLSPFIGRTAEMSELERQLRLASVGGHRVVVGIAGEPGVGKSRLGEEFGELQRSRGRQVLHTRCLEQGRWIPFHATRTFFQAALGIEPGTDPAAARDKIQQTLLAIDANLADAVPLVAGVLGLAERGEGADGTPVQAPANLLARACRALIEQDDTAGPAIFLLDDTQWMDPGADAVFGELVREPPRTPVLVLITYRRGHRRPWMDEPTFAELALHPLDRGATLALVRALVGHDRSLGALPERITERAAGNPFFVEEIVASLVGSTTLEGERGSYRLRKTDAEVAVPGSLHAVLAARIDQLGAREKAVLQSAAVIGREFSVSLLAPVAGSTPEDLAPILDSLETADFISSLGWGDEAVYLFRHPLLRETVYRSLLRDRRTEIHREVARALRRRHGDQAGEHVARIALHAEAAGDFLEAARWHRRAAHGTVRLDPIQGLEHWRRVLACTGRAAEGDEPSRLRMWACEAVVRLGFHHGLTPEESEPLLREGQQIARRLGDERATALLLSAEGALRGAAGDVEAAIRHNATAVALAENSHDAELAMLFGTRLVMSQRIAGRLKAALSRAEAMLEHYRSARIAKPTPGLVALRQLELARVVILLDRGDLQRGAAELQRLIAALRGDNAPSVLAWALAVTATLLRHSGDDSPVIIARIEEALALAQHLGVPSLLARALNAVATARLCQERWAEAHELAEQARASLSDVGHTFYVDVNPPLVLTYAHFGLGDVAAARAAGSEALRFALTRGSRLGQMDALLAYGRVLLRTGDTSERAQGLRLVRFGLALARQTRSRSREPHFWLELAAAARHAGDERRCQANQRRAVRLLLAMNAPGHVRRFVTFLATTDQTNFPLHSS